MFKKTNLQASRQNSSPKMLTINSADSSQRADYGQRETPTTQEIEDLLNNDTPPIQPTKKKRKVAYQEAVDTALNDGVLAQLSYSSSLYSDSHSSSQTSQLAVTNTETLSQLKQEQANIVARISSQEAQQASLDDQLRDADSLRRNLKKQKALIEETKRPAQKSHSLSC